MARRLAPFHQDPRPRLRPLRPAHRPHSLLHRFTSGRGFPPYLRSRPAWQRRRVRQCLGQRDVGAKGRFDVGRRHRGGNGADG